MPELVEVETIKNVLVSSLPGRWIESVRFDRAQTASAPDADTFCQNIAGRQILSLFRRGKFLSMRLDGALALTFHLRMTGQLLHTPSDFAEIPFTRAVFSLDDGSRLVFADLRRLGKIWLHGAQLPDVTGMDALGPEPDDPMVNAAYLREKFGQSARAIKTCLMDQHVLAGIGNIYSDEILFAAGIDPQTPAFTLTGDDWAAIAVQIAPMMAYFVEKNRISPEDYLRTQGREYRNTPYLNVYGRGGLPCRRCGTVLIRKKIGGRTSVSCPACVPQYGISTF